MALLVLVLAVAACGGDVAGGATTTTAISGSTTMITSTAVSSTMGVTTTTVPPSTMPPATTATQPPATTGAPVSPPVEWSGVRVDGNSFEVVAVSAETGASRLLATHTNDPDSEGAPTAPSDIGLHVGEQIVLVGICCEPTSGNVHSVPIDGTADGFSLVQQGFRFDVAGSVFARVDAGHGILGIQPRFPGLDNHFIDETAGAVDVAVARDGSTAIALEAPGTTHLGTVTESAVVSYSTTSSEVIESGRWPVEEGRYCGVVALEGGMVGLLVGERPQFVSSPCVGSTLDLFDSGTGALTGDIVDLGATVRHVSSDDTGQLIIATTVDGSVVWMGRDGTGGTLADGGYILADW